MRILMDRVLHYDFKEVKVTNRLKAKMRSIALTDLESINTMRF